MSNGDPSNYDRRAEESELLDPELDAYAECDDFGTAIEHPLLKYRSASIAEINRLYREKKAVANEALRSADWEHYIWVHERPYRAGKLLYLNDIHGSDVPADRWWQLVGDVWCDSENIWQNEEEWKQLFEKKPTPAIMNEDEQKALRRLPDPLTLYRGHTQLNACGWSWTTRKDWAEYFAHRFAYDDRRPPVSTMTIHKDNILAYFNRRKEYEVVVHLDNVCNFETRDIDPDEDIKKPTDGDNR